MVVADLDLVVSQVDFMVVDLDSMVLGVVVVGTVPGEEDGEVVCT